MPMPVFSKNSRRLKMMSLRLGVCSRKNLSEMEREGSWFIGSDAGLKVQDAKRKETI
jgi:hypothetical protein